MQTSFSRDPYLEEVTVIISCNIGSCEMLLGFDPSHFGLLDSSVVLGCGTHRPLHPSVGTLPVPYGSTRKLGLHVVSWSLIGIRMRFYVSKPWSSAGCFKFIMCLCGTILVTQYVFDGVGLAGFRRKVCASLLIIIMHFSYYPSV